MKDIFKLPVFPAADVFPMMADDELQELAADIAENGLLEPLVIAEIEGEILLIDGRNRRAACQMANIEPTTKQLNGGDPTAFVLSANIHRRHMTIGQRAMAVAMIYPNPRRGRGNVDPAKETESVSFTRIKEARFILRHAPTAAHGVLIGTKKFEQAYQDAEAERDKAESEEHKLDELRADYPELAQKVVEGELMFAGARAEADARNEQARTQRGNLFSHLGKIVYVADTIGSDANVQKACDVLLTHEKDFKDQEKYSLTQLVEACDLVQLYLPLFTKILKGGAK